MNKSKISSKSNTPRKEQTVKELFKSPDNIRLNHSKQGNVMMKNKQNPRYLKLKDEDEDKLHDKNVNIDDVSLCKSNDNMNNEINAKKEQVNAAEEFFSAPNSKENKIPEGTDLDINDFDGLSSNKRKRKKDWKSWSLTEKILFYEVIAKGGNHSSLQKLFETMKEVSLVF